jgi:signal transduction histidine kinase
VASLVRSQPDLAVQDLSDCIRLTDDSIKEVRTVSYLLYPPMLEEMGLKSAIPWYLSGFTSRSGIKTGFKADEAFGRLATDVELAMFRVLQESLTNVHRHSGSETAEVRLLMRDGNAVLEVEDKGKGFNQSVLDQGGKDWMGALGVGVRGMNERMRQLKGKLEITSQKCGTLVRAIVPVRHQRESYK